MWKSGVTAVLAAAAMISPAQGQTVEFEQGVGTLWEVCLLYTSDAADE